MAHEFEGNMINEIPCDDQDVLMLESKNATLRFELERLQEEIQNRRELSCDYHELLLDYRDMVSEKCAQLRRQACVLLQIRDVCALPDAPLEELPALIENLLSELADRQIRSDLEAREFEVLGDGAGEALPSVADMPRLARGVVVEMDPEDDEW